MYPSPHPWSVVLQSMVWPLYRTSGWLLGQTQRRKIPPPRRVTTVCVSCRTSFDCVKMRYAPSNYGYHDQDWGETSKSPRRDDDKAVFSTQCSSRFVSYLLLFV